MTRRATLAARAAALEAALRDAASRLPPAVVADAATAGRLAEPERVRLAMLLTIATDATGRLDRSRLTLAEHDELRRLVGLAPNHERT